MTTPLSHIRIVDLSQAWSGSYAVQLLADMGAEVIKVESRSRPDPWRGGFEGQRGLAAYPDDGGPGERPYNRAYLANSVNRNKLGITLDLGTAEGKTLFLDLVRTADMVTENFTPRVLGNLGLDFEALRRVNPRIILLSMPAFGLSGPYRDYPGIGGTIEPMSGNASLLGELGGAPEVSGVMYPDAIAGLNGASAALAALAHRDATGEGAHVEVSQQEAMIAMLGEFFAHASQVPPGPRSNRDLKFVPNGIYRCAGEEEWLAITCRTLADWRALAWCTGISRFADRSLRPRDARIAAEDEIDALLGEWAAGRSAVEAEQLLVENGIPAARVRTPREVLACPQLAASGYFINVPQPEGIATAPMAGIIARLSETPGDVRLPPTRHGEHSRAVLERILGLDTDTLDRLELAGIIGEGPPSLAGEPSTLFIQAKAGTDMEFRDIIFEPGTIARVRLNRPRYHNAQPPRMVEEMDQAFKMAVDDPQTRVIILSGEGKHFSAGHDLGTPDSIADREERGITREDQSRYFSGREYWFEASLRWRNLPIPTIAMVHGYCIYGGWIFASSMDIIFAANDALFLPSHTQYFSAPWDLGARKAKEILFEGRFITAPEAHEFGLVNRLFAPEDLERETLAYAERVSGTPKFTARMVKYSANNMLDTQGFTPWVEAAYHTYFINSQMRADPLRGESGQRQMVGVGRAKELLKQGFPATARPAE